MSSTGPVQAKFVQRKIKIEGRSVPSKSKPVKYAKFVQFVN